MNQFRTAVRTLPIRIVALTGFAVVAKQRVAIATVCLAVSLLVGRSISWPIPGWPG